MAVTPFLKRISNQGGTLYVFPSVSQDLTRTFVSKDYEFRFSHFACLNLPDIMSEKYSDGLDKGLYLGTFKKIENTTSDGIAKVITEEFQNYIMNFETAILNGEGDNDDYDNDIMTTVSEKVFFNWLQKVGGIKFNGDVEDYTDLSDRTVQYIGNIDVMNTVEINGDTFEELYLHIPSTVGASSKVYFRDGDATDNKNYLDKKYDIGKSLDDTKELIIGRTGDSPYGYGELGQIDTHAIFDDDENGNIYTGDSGHTIDFRDSSYENGSGISTMNENSSDDFEFNAVLIYYDFLKKTENTDVKKYVTNLYGILFLDNVTDLSDIKSTDSKKLGYIQRYPKKKETIYGNGNSFSLKVDLKIDTIPDTNTEVMTYTDPNSVVSMDLYEKAMTQLQKCVDYFYTQKNEIVELRNRVSELETVLSGIDRISDLRGEIDRLYNLYDGMNTVDTQTILDLIDKNSQKISSIIRGESNAKLQFDMDVIQSGTGVDLFKDKTGNKVVINSAQKYSMNTVYADKEHTSVIDAFDPFDTSGEKQAAMFIPLRYGVNFAAIYYTDSGACSKDVTIVIEDDEYVWEKGQSMKLYFMPGGEMISMDSKFEIATGVFLKIVIGTFCIQISGDYMNGHDLIEIICTGDGTFIYTIK